MTELLVRCYLKMPPAARTLLASARGYQLRQWRYGPETPGLVAEALERETWTAGQWRRWQEERLARMLDHAARNVPYYREQWAGRRRAGDRGSWERIENWPVLEKTALREHARAFLAEGAENGRLRHDTTSGTTGQPVHLWLSREAARAWYALVEARWRRWYGLSRCQRWALIGGQSVVPVTKRKPPYWVWNRGLRQLYLSAYHLFPGALPHYLDAMAAHRVEYVWGHSSGLDALAAEVLRSGRNDVRLKAAIASSEPLRPAQRERIAAAFGCPVRETYGMAEMAAGASECEQGRLHLWPEAGWYEVLPGGRAGELISTGLLNPAMPLVRYRIGDVVRMTPEEDRCPCGRAMPMLSAIDGRSSDMFYTSDGRRITPAAVETVFEEDMPLREAQIVQEELRRVRIVYVPAEEFTAATERVLRERVRARMGDVEVLFERVAQVPRGANGKFRAALSRLPAGTPDSRAAGSDE